MHNLDPDSPLDHLDEDEMESLDDLFASAMQAKNRAAKQRELERRKIVPSSEKLQAELTRVKMLYVLPENWSVVRELNLIDRETKTLLGHFTEFRHKTDASARKLVRSGEPVLETCEVEEVAGWLGGDPQTRVESSTWTEEHEVTADIWLTDMMVGAPEVRLRVCLKFGGIVRIDLADETQLASVNCNTVLQLPAGTNILPLASVDTKRLVFNLIKEQTS